MKKVRSQGMSILRFLKLIRILLIIGGTLSLILGLLSGGVALMSFLDQTQPGRGIMFADVEFFGLLSLICCVLGAFSLFLSRRIQNRFRQGEP